MADMVAVMWNIADVLSAIILLGSLVLMAKFYEEYLEVDISDLRDWRLITIGFAFYIAIKTHVTIVSNIIGGSVTGSGGLLTYPWYVVGLLSLVLVSASVLVFWGFYGLIKDYL